MSTTRGRPKSYTSQTAGVRKTFYLAGDNAAFLTLLAEAKKTSESNILNLLLEGIRKRATSAE